MDRRNCWLWLPGGSGLNQRHKQSTEPFRVQRRAELQHWQGQDGDWGRHGRERKSTDCPAAPPKHQLRGLSGPESPRLLGGWLRALGCHTDELQLTGFTEELSESRFLISKKTKITGWGRGEKKGKWKPHFKRRRWGILCNRLSKISM